MPFYVDCPTPFGAGEFYPDRSNNGWGTMTYTGYGYTENMTADFIDDNTVRLTPQDETVGCVGSYVFRRMVELP